MKRLSLLFALLAAASCTSAPPPRPVAAAANASHSLSVSGPARRVVLASFDGLSADELAEFGAPSFEALTTHATRVIPVEPTSTSVTHAAILTGKGPDQTGIVSNQFHKPGTPRSETARGLETEIATDTIVDRAHRAGKRVGCILFPFIDAISPRRTADWGLAWTRSITAPRIVHLGSRDFHSDWLPPAWGASTPRHPSFSPVMRSRIEWTVPKSDPEPVDLVAYDTSDDGTRNYDSFYVETRAGETPIGADRWFQVSVSRADGVYGSWSKLLDHDPSLSSVRIYWGAIQHNVAYPESFRKIVDGELGAWPGEPDDYHARLALGGGDGIDATTFIEQMDRLSNWLTRATLAGMQQMPFDLLLVYQPIIDETEHQFRIENDTQLYATAANRADGERARRAAYAAFDRAVGAMRAAIDVTSDALIVTGDHGLAPVDTEVRLNPLLPSNWRAFSNGNVANIYRFGGESDDTGSVIQLLTALHAPDGAPVFERVTRKPAAAHANTGDILAFAYPRFTLSNADGEPFARSTTYGQHGGLNHHHEFHTSVGVAGTAAGVQRIDVLPQTAIEPFVERLLGIAE